MARRRMHLMGYVVAGPTWHHNGSWRHARSDVPDLLDASRYEHIARVLELGKFDGLFFVDTLALVEFYNGSFDAVVRNGGQIFMMEPTQLLAAMARVTRNLGLAATMSTGFYPPFHIARAFASLDHISKGRAGWNIVTSMLTREAQNFGVDTIMDPDQRYDQADEVVEASCALWESWAPDAIVYRSGEGGIRGPQQSEARELSGEMGEDPRAIADTSVTAGAAGVDAGGLVGAGSRVCRALGGGGVHLAARQGGHAGVLCGCERADGEGRSCAVRLRDPARH